MRSNHYSKRSEQNRRTQIAQEAARIIIEDGLPNYQSAKLKAANRFGISNSECYLPCNEEIDDAMRQHHLIYSGIQQKQWITKQRRVALEAMEFLEAFSPRLTGPVLSGVSGQHATVVVHVFSDTPEAIIIRLLDAEVSFVEKSHDVMSTKGKLESFSRLCLDVDDTAIEVLMFPAKYLHNRAKSKGLLTERATIQQVRQLLGLNSPKPRQMHSIQSA